MTWMDIGFKEATKIVEWFEHDTFVNIIAPLLAEEETELVNQMLESCNPEACGRIKSLREFVLWHDKALSIAKQENGFK